MSLQPSTIAPYQSGVKKDKKPFLILDDAFQELYNAYCFREGIKKRYGIKLISRARRVLSSQTDDVDGMAMSYTTPGTGLQSIDIFSLYGISVSEPNAALGLGSSTQIQVILDSGGGNETIFTDAGGDGTLTITGAGPISDFASINYVTGTITANLTSSPGALTVSLSLAYYPSLPIVGMPTLETANINSEQAVVFDTKYAYAYGGGNFTELSSTTPTTWSGNDSDFFWGANYRGAEASDRLFFVTNFSGTTGDPIRYYGSSSWNDLTPVISNFGTGSETSFFQSRIIIPYYGRLVALNTYEGTTAGGLSSAKNFFNRCRFCQVGNPLEDKAWLHDEFGRGGFIDAPINEAITSARFYKSTLLVSFERSTWALQYVGEYGLPFVWERISSDFGSESTLSTVLFDEGVLSVGNRAIVGCTSNKVDRIDLDIPDTVFEFNNIENGKLRVNGIRDFQKEIVYWCYPDGGVRNKFPNRVLLYNYRNNTWATFRDNVTAFGQFTSPSGISWDTPTSWDGNTSWDDQYSQEYPVIICGNQQGYIHFYQYPDDFEDAADSEVDANESESLYISGITRSASDDIQLTVYNHNLEDDDVIYLTGLIFVNTADASTLQTNINDRFFAVKTVDDDTFDLKIFSFEENGYIPTYPSYLIFTPAAGVGTYMGGGNITLFPRVDIITKDFNPYQGQAQNMFLSYIDFQADATPESALEVNLILDSANNPDVFGNILIGNKQFPTNLGQTGTITGATKANPASIKAPNHSLNTDEQIIIKNVQGMTELNGNTYTVTFVDLDTFTINTDSTLFTTYLQGGTWSTLNTLYRYIPGSNYAWHRFYCNAFGQYLTIELTYSDAQMNTLQTHQSDFELNAMQIWHRPGGRLV